MSNPTTTALQGTGGGGGGGNNHLLNSSSTTTSLITNDSSNSPLDNLHFASSQLLSLLHAKDEAFQVLKSDLMDALNNEVKSLDEDNWMFEGPRSRISLISKPGLWRLFLLWSCILASLWGLSSSESSLWFLCNEGQKIFKPMEYWIIFVSHGFFLLYTLVSVFLPAG